MRPVVGRDLDRRPDLLLRQLGVARLRPGRQHGTRRDDLQQVGATGEQPPAARRTSSTVSATPIRMSAGSATSGREPGDLPAAARAGDVRPGTAHPRTLDEPGVDGVAQRDVDEARNVPTSRTVVTPARRVAAAFATPIRASSAADRWRTAAGSPASTGPTRWVCRSIRPGSTVCAD